MGSIIMLTAKSPAFLNGIIEEWKNSDLQKGEVYRHKRLVSETTKYRAWSWHHFYKFYGIGTQPTIKHQKKYFDLIEYLNDVLEPESKFIQIINKQNDIVYWWGPGYDLASETPDFAFIYTNDDKNFHLAYCDSNFTIVDIVIDLSGIDINLFFNEESFEDFESTSILDQWKSFYEGVGVSLSVYTPENIFTAEAYDFWKYNDNEIIEFYETSGKEETREELIKLMTYLFQYGIFKDGHKPMSKSDFLPWWDSILLKKE